MNPSSKDPPLRKRLKVTRACTECRRKKTKCDNELPCAPCLKSYTDCEYIPKFGRRLANKSCGSSEPDDSATTSSPTLVSNNTDKEQTESRPFIRARSPSRRSMTYTIQAIEHRLLEIEKILGFLLERHYPALPPLVLSPPSSSSSSTTTETETNTTKSIGTKLGTMNCSSGEMKRPTLLRKTTFNLPPLQTRPIPPLSHHVDMMPFIPGSMCEPLFDRKMPLLLQPERPIEPLTTYPHPSCIP